MLKQAPRVEQLIRAYATYNIPAGERIAIAFDSRLDVYLHLLALNALGVSVVPLNSGASDDELRHIIGHSDSHMIVCLPEYRDRPCGTSDLRNSNRVGSGVVARQSLYLVAPDRAAEAALLYTSGTTGKPKGCMLSNEYFLALGTLVYRARRYLHSG